MQNDSGDVWLQVKYSYIYHRILPFSNYGKIHLKLFLKIDYLLAYVHNVM